METRAPDSSSPRRLKVTAFGDLLAYQPQIDALADPGATIDDLRFDTHIGDVTSSSGLVVATCEGPMAGDPYSSYPRFNAPDRFADVMASAGLAVVSTASNHCYDRGPDGFERTLDVLAGRGIETVGTYRCAADRAARYPLLVERAGVRLAFLAATYGTNGIAIAPPHLVNRLDDKPLWRAAVRSSRDAAADLIVAIVHWGTEYRSLPDLDQRRWGRWLRRIGVDVVIGSHPHHVQPMEWRRSRRSRSTVTAWSLGNALGHQRRDHTDGGAHLHFTLSDSGTGQVQIEDVRYGLHWIWPEQHSSGRYQHHVMPQGAVGWVVGESDRDQMLGFLTREDTHLQATNVGVVGSDQAFAGPAARVSTRSALLEDLAIRRHLSRTAGADLLAGSKRMVARTPAWPALRALWRRVNRLRPGG